jgi:hypothetical protein
MKLSPFRGTAGLFAKAMPVILTTEEECGRLDACAVGSGQGIAATFA